MGYDPNGSWRIYKLRPDFNPADKVQVEDDITASVVLPRESLNDLDPEYHNPSVKLVTNCETLLFQRPDDAIYRGFDKDAEADIASGARSSQTFEPLTVGQAQALVDQIRRVRQIHRADEAIAQRFRRASANEVCSFVGTSPVGGRQSVEESALSAERPDLVNPRDKYLAEIGTRLAREIPPDKPGHFPVNAVLAGRRNNPPDAKTGIAAACSL